MTGGEAKIASKRKLTLTHAKNLINLGAINKETKKYETPLFANKKNKYKCPDCNQDVILRQGEVRKYHFAHYNSTDDSPRLCNYYNHPGESQIHKHAKELLKAALEHKSCKIFKECDECGNKTYTEFSKSESDTVRVECPFTWEDKSRKVADVAIFDNEGYVTAIFEVFYTHKTKEEDRPEPWYEFSALELIEVIENCEESFELKCVRQKICELCLKFKDLDEKDLKWFAEKKRIKKLEWYVRYKLGQRDFSSRKILITEIEGKLHSEFIRPDHLRFIVEASEKEEKDHNESIIKIFSKFYGTKQISFTRDLLNCQILIQNTELYLQRPCFGNGTVELIMELLLLLGGVSWDSSSAITYDGELRVSTGLNKIPYQGKVKTLNGLIFDGQSLTLDDLLDIHLYSGYYTRMPEKEIKGKTIPKFLAERVFSFPKIIVRDLLIYPSFQPEFIVGFCSRPHEDYERFSLTSKAETFKLFLSWVKSFK